ncbi:RED-like protein N-terminal region-domain-containing protein, partial [Hysterangium stoloniferum]
SLDASKPAFQPRKVKKKKTESTYRDRASDRRAGVNDYAEIESVLEDFEKRTAGMEDRDVVEEQRRYLGGDKDHTILVKGLDFALLEQNKSRAVDSWEEDDSLEAAFREAQSKSTLPRKRTREEIINALKEKRAMDGNQSLDPIGEAEALEKAKQLGKFKPIGAPEASNVAERKQGKAKKTVDDRPKKKKRKVVHSPAIEKGNQEKGETSRTAVASPSPVLLPAKELAGLNIPPQVLKSAIDLPAEPEDDYDIFADVGDYQGYDFEDEDEAHPTVPSDSQQDETPVSPILADTIQPKRWFDDDDTASIGLSKMRTPTPPPKAPEPAEQDHEEQTARLAPLASSALPSIRDFLAMDTQVEAREKRKAKKEKKRGDKKEKDSLEVKVNRDYQKYVLFATMF